MIASPTCSALRFPGHFRRFLRLVALPVIMAFGVMAAIAAADDAYMKIFNGIQDADAMAQSGKTEQALAKYRELYGAVGAFRKEYPEWDRQVISFRQSYLAQRIRTLTEELNRPEPTRATAVAGAAKNQGDSPIRFKLLDPGAEPRTALRLNPAAGDKQSLTMKIKMGMEMSMGGMQMPAPPIPAFTLALDATVGEPTAEGDIPFEFSFASVDVAESADQPPQVMEAMKGALGNLKGTQGKGMISSRGESKKIEVARPAGAGSAGIQGMPDPADLFSGMGTMFPEEPVGKGARWEVRRPVKSQGITIDQTETCELTELEGQKVTIKSTVAQRASGQKLTVPGQTGMAMTLDKMAGQGTATTTLDLTKIMPARSTARLKSDMSTSLSMQGQKQVMTMKLDYDIDLQSK